jgi:ABC-type branched-subunit amino acid transport system ATPase component
MNTGRLIAEGTLDEVASQREVIEAYLGKPL